MRENRFQSELIRQLKVLFPTCIIFKNDCNYIQGTPDLTILYHDKWAVLECKKDIKSSKRPNQDYYISLLDRMSFARFICPENKEEVLSELQQAFQS